MEETVLAGRYHLQEKVGSGGMADVYRASDEVLGRTVAVKIMHAQLAGDSTWFERFRREARAAASLHSQHVVTVYDWGHDNDVDFIVMELIEGEDMGSLMRREAPLATDRIARIGSQAADALTEAHSQGVIHRDISPGNILIAGDDSVKVADFGIARIESTVLTQTGSVLGSASYISPEQAQGIQAGPASDQYSLGVVLFEAATGRPPFQADTPVSHAYQHVNEPPPMPRDVLASVDPRLDQIIGKAIQKAPEDRFSSAAAMGDALRAIVDPRGGMTAPMPIVSRETAQGTETSVMAPQPMAANEGVRDATSETRRRPRNTVLWMLLVALIVLLGVGVSQCGRGGTAISMPAVTGMSLEAATQALEDAGLEVGDITRQPDAAGAGTVISQDPAVGSEVGAGTSVALTVSDGPATAPVPSLLGADEAKARAAIEQAGLVPVAGEPRYSSEVPAGRVLAQDPAPGQEVAQGSNVQYVLSLGPAPDPDDDDESKGKSDGRGKEKDNGDD